MSDKDCDESEPRDYSPSDGSSFKGTSSPSVESEDVDQPVLSKKRRRSFKKDATDKRKALKKSFESVKTSSRKSDASRSKFAAHYKFEGAGKEKHGICRHCEKKGVHKKVMAIKGNTNGLKKHLQACHKSEAKDVCPDVQPSTSKQGQLDQFFSSSKKKEVVVPLDHLELETLKNATVDWIARKMLPLSFFDDQPTEEFFRLLNPRLKLMKRSALRDHTRIRFNEMKASVKDLLEKNSSKIACTIDSWTSIANKSYYGITAHWIDALWSCESLTLDFIPAHGKHSGIDIAQIFLKCLDDYGLRGKVIGVTLDNASANTTFMNELAELDRTFSEDSHFRCMAHILNLGCQDLMKNLHFTCEDTEDVSDESENDDSQEIEEAGGKTPTDKLRTLLLKIKRSEQLTMHLKSACEAADIRYTNPTIDCKTRWNSAFDMMGSGIKLKKGLEIISKNQKSLFPYCMTEEEWYMIEKTHSFLKPFKTLSLRLGGQKYCTLPSAVVGFNLLVDLVEKTVKDLDEKEDRTRMDENLLLAFQACRDKVVKHYRLTNWIICMVLILDPRHKAEAFELTSWGKEMKEESMQKLREISTDYGRHTSPLSIHLRSSSSSSTDELDFNQLYKKETKGLEAEIASYLGQPRTTGSEDILLWWKMNSSEFPTLSLIARDYLSIPATSVPAERLFSKAGLLLRKHRNRLGNDAAQWLLCLNSWVDYFNKK